MVLLPEEVVLSHVATPADVLGVLRDRCGVEVPPRVLQAVELRLAGNALAGAGDLEAALAQYRSALALAPGRGEHMLHSNAAAACLELGRHEEALGHARAAVALAPAGFTNVRGWRGLACWEGAGVRHGRDWPMRAATAGPPLWRPSGEP